MWKCAVCGSEQSGLACRTCGTLRWEDPMALRTLAPLAPEDIRALRDRQRSWAEEKTRREQVAQEANQALRRELEGQMRALLDEKLGALERRMEEKLAELWKELRQPTRQEAPAAAPQPLETELDPEAAEERLASPEELFERGRKLLDRDPEAGASLLEMSARMGYVPAMLALGDFCAWKKGADRDLDQAKYWYAQAAEQGDAYAQYLSGLYAKKETDLAGAVSWYRKAASQNHVMALTELARCYRNGEGVKKDVTAAAQYLKHAMNLGYAPAKQEYNALFDWRTTRMLNEQGFFRIP